MTTLDELLEENDLRLVPTEVPDRRDSTGDRIPNFCPYCAGRNLDREGAGWLCGNCESKFLLEQVEDDRKG